MKFLFVSVLVVFLVSAPAVAQVSESTEDWPAWQKISAGSLSAASLLLTIGALGASNADAGDGSDSGDQSDSDGSSESERKMQGYAEELKDELLVLVANASSILNSEFDDHQALNAIREDSPLLSNYYRDLLENHQDVIRQVNLRMTGETVVDRLNELMLIHFFGHSSGIFG